MSFRVPDTSRPLFGGGGSSSLNDRAEELRPVGGEPLLGSRHASEAEAYVGLDTLAGHGRAPAAQRLPLTAEDPAAASPSTTADANEEVRKLLSAKYAERADLERQLLSRRPQLQDFPILFHAMTLTGLLESGDGYFRSRVPWAAAYLVISISPFLPGLFLPLCSAKCEKDESCTGCVTSFSAGRFVFDVAFTLVMTAHSMELAHVLSEVYRASCLKREIVAFARPCCLALVAVFTCLWVVLPSLDVFAAIFNVGYELSSGDVASRCLWVVAGVPRALFMTANMGAVLLVMRLHSFDLKAVRAAARLAHSEALREPRDVTSYFASLLNAYQYNNNLLAQSSVRLQKVVCFLLGFGINNIFSMFTWYYSESSTMRRQQLSDRQRAYDILEDILHDGSFLLMALITLGSAAHITALCDSTVRAVHAGFSGHMTSWLGIAPSGSSGAAASRMARAHIADPVAQEAMLLVELLNNASERGGFRIVGQRVTFGWFALGLSMALGVANFGLATSRQTTSDQ